MRACRSTPSRSSSRSASTACASAAVHAARQQRARGRGRRRPQPHRVRRGRPASGASAPGDLADRADRRPRCSAKDREPRNRADETWNLRVPVKAGQRDVVGHVPQSTSSALDETARLPFLRPYPAGVNIPETRLGAHLRSVEIEGPHAAIAGGTPSRRRIFACCASRSLHVPAPAMDEQPARTTILTTLARARVSPSGHERRRRAAAGVLPRGAAQGGIRCAASSARCAGCWSARSSCSASSAIRPSVPPGTAYRDQRSRARVAAVVLPVEQHSRRRAARRSRRRRS